LALLGLLLPLWFAFRSDEAMTPLFHCPSCGLDVLPEWLTDIVYAGCPAWKCPHCETVWYFEFKEES